MGHSLPSAGSPWFDVGGPDHLGPLLGFIGDELAEFGGCHRHRSNTQIGKSRLQLGIGEGAVGRLIELVHDLGGVFLGAPIPYQPVAS